MPKSLQSLCLGAEEGRRIPDALKPTSLGLRGLGLCGLGFRLTLPNSKPSKCSS